MIAEKRAVRAAGPAGRARFNSAAISDRGEVRLRHRVLPRDMGFNSAAISDRGEVWAKRATPRDKQLLQFGRDQ